MAEAVEGGELSNFAVGGDGDARRRGRGRGGRERGRGRGAAPPAADCAAAAAAAGEDAPFDAAGKSLLSAAGRSGGDDGLRGDVSLFSAGGSLQDVRDYLRFVPTYSDADAVWKHPRTGARVLVGNWRVARSAEMLERLDVSHIVNCQQRSSANFHEGDGFVYFRFPVAEWHRDIAYDAHGTPNVGAFFAPFFRFVDDATAAGHSVLVHCLAGAHRAGTAGVAFLMHARGLDLAEALAEARRARPIISPFSSLLQLLILFDDECAGAARGGELGSEDVSVRSGNE